VAKKLIRRRADLPFATAQLDEGLKTILLVGESCAIHPESRLLLLGSGLESSSPLVREHLAEEFDEVQLPSTTVSYEGSFRTARSISEFLTRGGMILSALLNPRPRSEVAPLAQDREEKTKVAQSVLTELAITPQNATL
jgi:hypothetical protein